MQTSTCMQEGIGCGGSVEPAPQACFPGQSTRTCKPPAFTFHLTNCYSSSPVLEVLEVAVGQQHQRLQQGGQRLSLPRLNGSPHAVANLQHGGVPA